MLMEDVKCLAGNGHNCDLFTVDCEANLMRLHAAEHFGARGEGIDMTSQRA